MTEPPRLRTAGQAITVAAVVLFVFLFFGQYILDAFMIDFSSLRVGGGIILAILGVELALGFSVLGRQEEYSPAVVLGTPILTGPGAIVTAMIFVEEHGYVLTAVGSVLALVASWVMLALSHRLVRLLRESGLEILSTLTGILLVSVAVEFVASGLFEML